MKTHNCWLLLWLLAGGLLGLAGCGTRCPADSVHRSVAGRLVAEAAGLGEGLAGEVMVPSRRAPCYAAISLPVLGAPADAAGILRSLDERRPLYVVADDDVTWEGVISQPWFAERYHQVARWREVYPEPTSLGLFAYRPTRFDLGLELASPRRFETDAVVLRGLRLSSLTVEPEVPLYLTLLWDDLPGGNYADLMVEIELMHADSGRSWSALQDSFAPTGLSWEPQFRLARRYVILPPADLPEGPFDLQVRLVESSGRPVPVEGSVTDLSGLRLAVLVHPPDVSRTPVTAEHNAGYSFGDRQDGIVLASFDAPPWAHPGEDLRLALNWTAGAGSLESYHVFVHLLSPEGQLVTQADGVPVFGFYPTTDWEAGESIRDVRILNLSEALPAGAYTISVGLYRPDSGVRLPAYSAEGAALAQDQVPLHQVTVYPSP